MYSGCKKFHSSYVKKKGMCIVCTVESFEYLIFDINIK